MSINILIRNHLKNVPGWRTKNKFVLFSVDDYGSVRVNSLGALDALKAKGVVSNQRFDKLDALEGREDLRLLFETLSSVQDKNGQPACFSPYSLPCNINFEAIRESDFKTYAYEDVADTFTKLAAVQEEYKGAWDMWQYGLDNGYLKPEFHGREHMNVSIFEELLALGNSELKTLINHNSYITIPAHKSYPHGWSAAFAYRQEQEIERFAEIITTGIEAFKRNYGIMPVSFTPPAQHFPPQLDSEILNWGFKAMDRPYRQTRKISETASKSFTHKQEQLENGLIQVVRNVVFEPTDDRGFDWVDYSFKQVEAAFRMHKPANISSHRVNFSGNIDSKNREKGLLALKELLKRITTKWPDVQFISVNELVEEISEESKNTHNF